MALKVYLSFKKTEKDMYDFIQSQLSPSIYLKELIKKEMGNIKNGNKKATLF